MKFGEIVDHQESPKDDLLIIKEAGEDLGGQDKTAFASYSAATLRKIKSATTASQSVESQE